MNSIFKTFLGLFIIFTMAFVGIGITNGVMTVGNAKTEVDGVIQEIENSYYNGEVAWSIAKKIAVNYEEEGEGIQIIFYRDNAKSVIVSALRNSAKNIEYKYSPDGGTTVSSVTESQLLAKMNSDLSDVYMAKAKLFFRYRLFEGTKGSLKQVMAIAN